MTFTPEQLSALSAPLNRTHVAQRQQAGHSLSYIEAWHAIAEANRIFGFDGWTRETVDLIQLGEPRLVDCKYRVGYRAKVRITVKGITREGCGFGSGIDKDVDQAHESALKEAESDAMKRALMTFGNPFGLALYDKTQSHVSDGSAPAETPANSFGRKSSAQAKRDKDDEKIKAEIRGLDKPGLGNWMARFSENTAHLPFAWLDSIRDFAEGHLADLDKPPEAEELDEAFRNTIGPGGGRDAGVAGNGRAVEAA